MILPNSNLPPLSQQWAAKLPEIVTDTDNIIKASRSTTRASSAAQSASMDLLSKQITGLSAQASRMPIVMQIPIAETQAGFTGTGTANYVTLYSLDIGIPNGKTSADVFVFGSVVQAFSLVSGTTYMARVGINGSYDLSSTFATSRLAGVSCARTGVTGTFTVSVQASATSGASFTTNSVYLTVMVMFK